MPEKYVRQRSGSKAIAIDNREQIARLRLLFFFALVLAAGLASVPVFLFAR